MVRNAITAISLGFLLLAVAVISVSSVKTSDLVSDSFDTQGYSTSMVGAAMTSYIIEKAIANATFDVATVFTDAYLPVTDDTSDGVDRYKTDYDYYFDLNAAKLLDAILVNEYIHQAYCITVDGFVPIHSDPAVSKTIQKELVDGLDDSLMYTIRYDADGYEYRVYSNSVVVNGRQWGYFQVWIPTAYISQAVWSQIPVLAGIISGIALVGVIGILIVILKTTIAPLRRSIKGITIASSQMLHTSNVVSETSQTIASGANEQAATVDESTTMVQEIARGAKTSTSLARAAAEDVATIKDLSDTSRSNLEEVLSAMDAMRESASKTAVIVDSIDKIARETLILALNANIEAVHAGDSGSGFAVIARQVLLLAEQVKAAARTTTDLLEESQDTIQQGTDVIGQMLPMQRSIFEQVDVIASRIDEIHVTVEMSQDALSQIATSMGHIANVTQSNAASAEGSAQVSAELFAQTREFERIAGELVVVVEGAKKAARREDRDD